LQLCLEFTKPLPRTLQLCFPSGERLRRRLQRTARLCDLSITLQQRGAVLGVKQRHRGSCGVRSGARGALKVSEAPVCAAFVQLRGAILQSCTQAGQRRGSGGRRAGRRTRRSSGGSTRRVGEPGGSEGALVEAVRCPARCS
jgi:hypothetical protein